MKVQSFENFSVYSEDDNNIFIHIDIEDEAKFYRDMFDYFFSESNLLKYVENSKSLVFRPSKKGYTILAKELKKYIDTEVMIQLQSIPNQEVKRILEDEGWWDNKCGNLQIRNDKAGKIGEYIFTCILREYFHFDCIIPKLHLATDYNMSIYGIDVVFYSAQDDLILFGESKVTKNIDNGIKLIKQSLGNYEKQISDEFELVLSNRLYGRELKGVPAKMLDAISECLTIEEFIDELKISRVGIPIFIAHGEEKDPKVILRKLQKIPRNRILDRDTVYIAISLPIIDKAKMMEVFASEISKKEQFYESSRTP